MGYWPFNEPLIINLLHGNDCLESTFFLKKTKGNPTQSLKMQLSPTNLQSEMTLRVNDYGWKCA